MHELSRGRSESLVRGYTGRMAITLAVGSVGVSMGRQLLPLLVPTIIDELAISASLAGVALSTMWVAFAVSQYPAGRFADQWSRTTMLVGGAGIMILCFGLLTTVLTYPLLVLGVAGVGIGSGFYVISVRAMMSDLFVERRGQALGLSTSANMLGGVTASGISIVVLTLGVWQLGFLPVVGLLVIVTAFIHVWSREPYVVSRIELDLGASVKRVFGTGRLRWIVVGYTLFMFSWQGVFSFLPTVLGGNKGFSPSLTAAGFAILFVVGIIAMPLAGKLSDDTHRLSVGAGALLVSSFGLSLFIVSSATPPVLAGVFLFAVGITSFPPVMQAFLMDTFPEASMAGDFGTFRTIYFGLGSLGPTYVGFVADHRGYLVAFAGIVAVMLISAAITLAIYFSDTRG